jgi:tetratricopeptide (TPR) repeat protein
MKNRRQGQSGLRLAGLMAVAVALACAFVMPAWAAAAAGGSARAARQALFRQVLADPGNVKLALAYAKLAAANGDLEGAVSTLERLLIVAPDVAALDLELGTLYYQLGAYDVASSYFKAAIKAPDVTPAIKGAAAGYTVAAAQGGNADRNMASLTFGARYQTNANSGAESPLIDLNGVPFLLSPAAMAGADANGFVSANLHLSDDLHDQGDRFDTDISAYGALYAQQHDLDALAIEAKPGPVYNLKRFGIANSTLQVYGIFDGESLGGDPYYLAYGLGTALTAAIDPATQSHLRLEYRQETFENSALRPAVSDMDGARVRLSTDLRRQLNPALAFYASVYGERKAAVAADNADWEMGGAVGTTLNFSAPGGAPNGPWTFDLSLGALQRNFDGPDPSISADARRDTEGYVQGVLTVPMPEGWAAQAAIGYSRQVSTYSLYTFSDTSTSLALTKSF